MRKARKSMNYQAELQKIINKLGFTDIREALVFPRFFQIETIHYCDGKCRICTVRKWNPAHKFIDKKIYDKVVGEIIENADRVEQVCLTRAGEPLLDDMITDRIAHLKRHGIKKVVICTNAAHLTGDKANALLDANLDEIMITFDSINKKTYESIKGFEFEPVLANILNFIKLRNKRRPATGIRMRAVLQKANAGEMDTWKSFWIQRLESTDRVYAKKMHTWGNQHKLEDEPIDETITYHPCSQLWSSMHILTNGEIPFCVADYEGKISLGNVANDTLANIWKNSKVLNKNRDLHARGLKNEIPLCPGCKIWDKDQIV